MAHVPRTRYAKCGEIDIAYQVFGDGPIDLLVLPGPAHPVTDDELRDVVSRYWVVDDIRHARIHGNLPPDFGGLPGVELRDEPKGRKSIAAWLLSAHLE